MSDAVRIDELLGREAALRAAHGAARRRREAAEAECAAALEALNAAKRELRAAGFGGNVMRDSSGERVTGIEMPSGIALPPEELARLDALRYAASGISLPADVIDAARVVDHYFASRGVSRWSIFGVASRAETDDLRAQVRKLRKTIQDTHGPAEVHVRCERPSCAICEGGLYVCTLCGAAEAEAEERVCTGGRPR